VNSGILFIIQDTTPFTDQGKRSGSSIIKDKIDREIEQVGCLEEDIF